jgi:hypothetical protein
MALKSETTATACACGAQITRDEASANGWRDESGDLWCENGNLHAPATMADLFPLTCAWCKNTPATHLLVFDFKPSGKTAADRQEQMLCTTCAHQPTVLTPEFVGWWLYELAPDRCEEAGR